MQSKRADNALRAMFGLPAKGNGQVVPIADSANNSTVLGGGSTYRIVASVDCWVCACESAESATDTDSMLMGALIPELFTPMGEDLYISCLKFNNEDDDGSLSIMKMSIFAD